MPRRVHLEPGDAAGEALECYPTPDARRLLEMLVGRRTRYEIAEARVAELEAEVGALQAQLVAADAGRELEAARVQFYKEQVPGFWKRHLGCAAGFGAAADGHGEVGAPFAIACGVKW